MVRMAQKLPFRTLCFTFAFMALFGGCATIFTDGKDTVTFNSNVEKTKVFLDGSKIGETPLTLDIERKLQKQQLKFVAEGYETQELTLATKFNSNGWVILDITGTVITITPGAVDALSGNLIKYSPNEYHIEMQPVKTGDASGFRQKVDSKKFAARNFLDLQIDLAQGKGEFLEGLKGSFHIEPAHDTAFDALIAAHREALATAPNGLELWHRLNQLIRNDPQLNGYHMG